MAVKRYKNGMTEKQYLKYQNKTPFYNPTLPEGITLEEKLKQEWLKYKWSNELKFSYVDYDKKLDCFVAHIYGVKQVKNKYKIEEVMRIAEDYTTISKNCYYVNWGMAAGFHIVYDRKNGYRSSYYGSTEYVKEFYYNPEAEYDWKIFVHEIIELSDLIAKDETIKYCSYKENSHINFIQYIRLYRKYPIAEMLMKLGFTRMIHEKGLKIISENKEFRTWLFNNQNEIHAKNMAFQTVYNAFKKNKSGNPSDYYDSLMYRIEAGKEIAFHNKEVYNELLKYTTQEKILKYLQDNKINNTSYADYITACKWLRLDFSDTKVLFPKNFQEVHDDYTKQYGAYQKKLEKEKQKEKDKLIMATATKYSFLEYSNGTYQVITAKSKSDLIDEGAALKHCVGRMDYDKRQIDEKSIICFIRKCEEPNKPFATAEVSLTNNFKINQCYGEKDKVVPEIAEFNEEWIEHTRKAFKKLTRSVA